MLTRLRSSLLVTLLVLSATVFAKPAVHPLNVTLLGDSLAYGAGDEEGKGIAGRITPELQRRGVASVMTTNLGVTGATTIDVAARLRDASTRHKLSAADAIVLSMGANDVRAAVSHGTDAPFAVIDQVLRNVRATVTELRRLNPTARILILGAYAPLPEERAAVLLEPLITIWDATLEMQFVDDPLVTVVRMSDIVNGPERLSRIDSFHPGGAAYQRTAARIAELLTEQQQASAAARGTR